MLYIVMIRLMLRRLMLLAIYRGNFYKLGSFDVRIMAWGYSIIIE